MMAVLLSMTGCEYHFELDNIVEDPLICIRSYIPIEDSTVIRINKTVPVTVIGKVDTALVSPAYSLICNGKEIDPSAVYTDNGSLMIKTGGFRNGDKIEISAVADGTAIASASTTIPEPFPGYRIETSRDENGDSWARILFDDMPENGNFYGAAIEYHAIVQYKNSDHHVEKEGNVYIRYDDEELPFDYNGYYPYYITCEDGLRDVILWDDKDIVGGAYEIRMNFNMRSDQYDIIERNIRIHLLRFSEEMYRHLYAEASMDNFFASLGFASPSFTYNSIDGGTGYFGAYSYTCSEWITETQTER